MFGGAFDATDQIRDALERATTNRLLRDQSEPTFNLVEPRGVGRGVVNVVAGTSCQPRTNFRMFVRRIVVADQVHVEMRSWRRILGAMRRD